MPAQVVSLRFCAQWFMTFEAPSRSSPGAHHVVRFVRGEGARCTCKAFEASSRRRSTHDLKECRHVGEVMRRACLWNEQWYAGGDRTLAPVASSLGQPTVAGDSCPECGGPVCLVRVAA